MQLVVVLLACVVATVAFGAPPNVLFIAVDDLRPELGCYGKAVHSPHIDELARNGTLFERAYVQCALCMPSRVSVLTGRRPDTTGVVDFSVRFRDILGDVVTLPQHFKNHGYHTAAFGKVFHRDDPVSWSEPLWNSDRAHYHTDFGKQVLAWTTEDHRRVTYVWDLGDGITKTKRPGGLPWEAPDVPDNALRDGHIAEAAIAKLQELKDQPFFLAVGFHKPHLPFIAPKKYFDLYDREQIMLARNPDPPHGAPKFATYNWNDLRHYYGIPDVGPVSDDQARDLKHAYYACVSFTDAQVGRLLQALDEAGLRETTIVILWGDHGWQLGEHGMWDKHSNFETSTHAPLIIHVPGQQPGRTPALVEFVDIYPTLCELCHLPLDEGLEGSSFVPLIRNPNLPWKSAAFSQYQRVIPGYGDVARGMGYSMRTDRYRFTEWVVPGTDFRAYELYDHHRDPDENRNLAGHSEHEPLVETLTRKRHAGWKAAARNAVAADVVLIGGKVLTMDAEDRIVTAVAVREGRILAVGTDSEIQRFVGEETEILRLNGKTVIPGIIAAHCHAVGVARNELEQPHEELLTIADVQDWIRQRAQAIPAGTWIRVPRSDITRLEERRHPTVEELDATCTSHPVIFTAARKSALNSLGLKLIGLDEGAASVRGLETIRDAHGRVRLVAGAEAHLKTISPGATFSQEQILSSLRNVHRHYNAVGITSIFERAGSLDDYLLYRKLQQDGTLTVRMTQTFRSSFQSAADVAAYTERLGMTTGDGDEWVRVGPLKIVVDGGIHWGNTYLREPYGDKRIRFYAHEDPAYQGDLNYSVELMTELFREGHRLGWQWCTHVTGDAGVDAVLEALEAVHRDHPEIAARRFSLTHAYFPALDSIARARPLGVCVDTQPSLYFKDSAAIAEIYGAQWAARFIGLGDWIRGGVPTAIAGDHMLGLDPNQAMNAYNPLLMLQVAVTRRNREGNVYGDHQRINRLDALRCLTRSPAYLSFEEDVKGSLEEGKLADLAVLDRDYLTCPENQIAEIKVLQTMIDGRFVYDRLD